MPKSYEVSGTRYEFPDHYTDAQVQGILTQQGIIKAPAVPADPGRAKSWGNPAVDVVAGIGSGVISTGVGAYELLRKVPSVADFLPAPSPYVRSLTEPADTLAAKAGKFIEQAAEFVVPAAGVAKVTKAAPLVGRMAAEGATAGAVAGVQTGGDPVATTAAAGLGAAAPAAGAAASAAYKALKPAVTRLTPAQSLVRALKPKATNLQFNTALERAMPELKASEQSIGRPISGIDDLLNATKDAKKRIWAEYEVMAGPQRLRGVSGEPIAEAIEGSIPAKLRLENPERAAALQSVADKYRRAFTVQELEELLKDTNAELRSYYAKYPTAQRAATEGNAEVAHTVAQGNALRKLIYNTLDDIGEGAGPAELKKRYGSLLNVEEEIYRRQNVAARQAPESLSEQISGWRAAGKVAKGAFNVARGTLSGDGTAVVMGTGDIAEAVGSRKAAQWLKEQNTTDALIRRAFKNFSQSPTPVEWNVRQPAGLLTEGSLKTPPPADPSGLTLVPAQYAVREGLVAGPPPPVVQFVQSHPESGNVAEVLERLNILRTRNEAYPQGAWALTMPERSELSRLDTAAKAMARIFAKKRAAGNTAAEQADIGRITEIARRALKRNKLNPESTLPPVPQVPASNLR
jgi:hypothetical protein